MLTLKYVNSNDNFLRRSLKLFSFTFTFFLFSSAFCVSLKRSFELSQQNKFEFSRLHFEAVERLKALRVQMGGWRKKSKKIKNSLQLFLFIFRSFLYQLSHLHLFLISTL